MPGPQRAAWAAYGSAEKSNSGARDQRESLRQGGEGRAALLVQRHRGASATSRDACGVGLGKANEVAGRHPQGGRGRRRRTCSACRSRSGGSIPHVIVGHVRRGRGPAQAGERRAPASSPGAGVRAVLEVAGVQNVLTKCLGTPQPAQPGARRRSRACKRLRASLGRGRACAGSHARGDVRQADDQWRVSSRSGRSRAPAATRATRPRPCARWASGVCSRPWSTTTRPRSGA